MKLVTGLLQMSVVTVVAGLAILDVRGEEPVGQPVAASGAEPTADEWCPARRAQDPLGFVVHVSETTCLELKAKQDVQAKLATELVRLNEQYRDVEKQRQAADRTACELRVHVQSGCFPVQIAGKCYPCPENVISEISVLLAQCDGFDCTLKSVAEERRAARHENEKLIVQINSLKSHLVLLEARKARLTAGRACHTADHLFAATDALLPEISDKPTPHEIRVAKFLQETSASPCQNIKTGTKSSGTTPAQQTAKPVFSQF